MKVDIVTAERVVCSVEDVDIVLAPGVEGQLGILPNHAPLLTALAYGELVIRKGAEEEIIAIGGGFMDVRRDQVTVLADTAERAEEIDIARAEVARRRAEEMMRQRKREDVDFTRAEAALRRSLIRLKVAETRRRKGGRRADVKRPTVRTPE